MEKLDLLNTLRGRRVLLTGHTGFKGGWLALWLHQLGAEVHGFALDPNTEPALFEVARVAEVLASDTRADLRDAAAIKACVARVSPELVLHLAAQPLVRESYRDPAGTWASNVQGTVHMLDALRGTACRAAVVITTDKVYANQEWDHPYRESDALGGHDPYSASKAACELVVESFRKSFFTDQGLRLASARAGNVIGGGDWAAERLVPDILKALDAGRPVPLRHPASVRPWQHVLEPLSGYLRLAAGLLEGEAGLDAAWNFGPEVADAQPVIELVRGLGAQASVQSGEHPHEAGRLELDIARARHRLGWRPRWPLNQALAATLAWHQAWRAGQDMQSFSLQQIEQYAPS
ncbi:CDP-glucose 4,6-dehydratase [Inhella inkyongensis]|uniref:CDP-glucose 4,6-dehydratase n=1 Tax=Inhella inkyongensis TaxID=392593 RepID=UPI002873BC86|nr:CDP-glucose 4,6-dehydratase [Inhella inkyongensis]